ncbi:MAG: hypothetical protein QNK05_03940, partial [Myxococcota bacterium]|nr:hypothetical protein [Myxococcota bacterium]
DVCPFEAKAEGRTWPDPLGLRARLDARPEWRAPTLAWLLELDAEAHRTATRRTALRREGHRGLIRNALVAAGNSRSPALRSAIERHAAGEDPVLAEHARWALARLDSADGGVSGSA